MNTFRKLINNEYIYSVLTKIFLVGLGLVHSAIFARYLGASLNGSINYITSITSIAAIIVTGGIHQAYPYFRKKYGKEQYIDKYMTMTTDVFALLAIIAIVLFVIEHKNTEIALMGILTVVTGYSTIAGHVLLVETPNTRNKIFMVSHVCETILVIALYLFTKANIVFAVIAYIFADVFKIIAFVPRIHFHIDRSYHLSDLKELYTYGFFPMIALLLTTLNYKIDVIMLKHYSFISLAQVGVYSIGYTIANKTLLIPDSLKVILISKLAKGKGHEEVARIMRLSFAVCLLVAICIVLLGKPFVNLMYGEEYAGAYGVICISVCGTVFMTFFKMVSQYNIMNKKQALNAGMLTISIVINVILNLFFVPIYGINGAAMATAIGYLVCSLVFILFFCKTTHTKLSEAVLVQKSDIMPYWNKLKARISK